MSLSEREVVLQSLEDAVALIPDGAVIGIGGCVTDGHPMALVRGLARRGVRDLVVVAPTGGLDVEILIACGCVSKVVASYVGLDGLAAVGPLFRRAVERGDVVIEDLDEAHCVLGLRAAAQRLPFLPWRGGLGTALPDLNSALVPFVDPVAGEELLAVPALHIDVALIHGEAADSFGNVQLAGTGNMDGLIASAADRVLAQVERVVSNEEIRRRPERTRFWRDTTIVRAPWGTHPCSSVHLSADTEHLSSYVMAARAAARGQHVDLEDYLERYVRRTSGHGDYLDAVSASRLAELVL